MEIKKCTLCGNEKIKKGKLHGVASLQALNSHVGIGGSELIISFCSECGEVVDIKVANPERVDYTEGNDNEK